MDRVFDGVWISANLWFTTQMNITEKVILLEVKSLDNEFGCIATNKKIGEVLQLKPNTVSLILKSLEEKGFIKIKYSDYNTFSGRSININYESCSDFFTPPIKSKGVTEKSKGLPEKSIHSNTISNKDIDKSISNGELPPANSPVPDLSPMKKCQMFIEQFNRVRRTKFKSNGTVCGKLSARLKEGYTSRDIFLALKNAMADQYHQESNFKYLTPEFILRSDKLEKFLNATTDLPPEVRKLVQ